jgi:Flp pilus assembly secretin CpaC
MRYFTVVAAILLASAALAEEPEVTVAAGGKKVVAFASPAATLYIENASVVDAGSTDSRHIVLTGKSRGTTEIMAIDTSGTEVYRGRITVVAAPPRQRGVDASDNLVLQRGSERVTYACSDAHCQVAGRSGKPQAADATLIAPAAAALP